MTPYEEHPQGPHLAFTVFFSISFLGFWSPHIHTQCAVTCLDLYYYAKHNRTNRFVRKSNEHSMTGFASNRIMQSLQQCDAVPQKNCSLCSTGWMTLLQGRSDTAVSFPCEARATKILPASAPHLCNHSEPAVPHLGHSAHCFSWNQRILGYN